MNSLGISFRDAMECSMILKLSNRIIFAATAFAIGASTVVTERAEAAEAKEPVTISFRAQVGEEIFQCGRSYAGVGKPAVTVTPIDFRYYITNMSLIDKKGHHVPVELDQDGVWQYRDAALLDFEDGTGGCQEGNAGINKAVHGKVPRGQYVGLAFAVGLPFDLDHGDATLAPSPLNVTSMFWAWSPGYRFLKIDLFAGPADAKGKDQAGFSVHIGSMGCDGVTLTDRPTQCLRPNVVSVEFAAFDPAHQVVIADLKEMLSDTDVTKNMPDSPPGCMSSELDDDCRGVLPAFGLPFGDGPVSVQRAFRTGQ